MTAATPSPLADTLSGKRQAAAGRFGRLATQVRRMRTRSAGGNVDRWMLILGGTLMPLGALLIVLGWYGAAHTPLPFEQNDYLISGGLLGLALVIGGGFVYFAYWQTIRVRESREQARDMVSALARLEALLTGGMVAPATGRTGAPGGGSFVATPSGSIFHRADCTVVAGRTDLTAVNADKTKLEPCRICTPLAADAAVR